MIAILRSSLFLLLATLITAPFGLFVTLAVVLPMRYRFALIALWRAMFMAVWGIFSPPRTGSGYQL